MELGGRGGYNLIDHPLLSFSFFPAHDGCPSDGGCRMQSSKSGKEVGDRKAREKITGSRREAPQDEETKFAALVRSHREAEKRCKFEELQAASRKLERRLYEEDEHLRANKERPGRCFFISDLERIILHLEELCITILNLVKYLAFEK